MLVTLTVRPRWISQLYFLLSVEPLTSLESETHRLSSNKCIRHIFLHWLFLLHWLLSLALLAKGSTSWNPEIWEQHSVSRRFVTLPTRCSQKPVAVVEKGFLYPQDSNPAFLSCGWLSSAHLVDAWWDTLTAAQDCLMPSVSIHDLTLWCVWKNRTDGGQFHFRFVSAGFSAFFNHFTHYISFWFLKRLPQVWLSPSLWCSLMIRAGAELLVFSSFLATWYCVFKAPLSCGRVQ